MINAGSQSATLAGLADFTTQTTTGPTSREDSSTVDIGYHYVALDASGNALDSNSDGIPDWWSDLYGPNPLDPLVGASGDPDGDGLANLQEYQRGSSPIEHEGLANPLGLPQVHARYLRIISRVNLGQPER